MNYMRINTTLSVNYSLYGLFLQNSIFILQTLELQGTKDLKLNNIYYGRPNHWNRYSLKVDQCRNGKGHSAECCKEAIDKLTNQ
jgi:hypothetical protein